MKKKSKALATVKPRDVQKEIQDISDNVAHGYHRIAELAIEDLTADEIKSAARMNPKEAPMFMHMSKDFVRARQGVALAEKKKAKVNINIMGDMVVNLPQLPPPATDVVVLPMDGDRNEDDD